MLKKEITLGGLFAVFIVLWSTFIMAVINMFIATQDADSGPEIISALLNTRELLFIAAIFLSVVAILKRQARLSNDKRSEAKAKSEGERFPFESTNKTELFGFVGLGIAGLLALSVQFPVENIGITNVFWLWISLVPLLLALMNAHKNVIEKKHLFAISYIISFAISVLIVSNFFNFFVNLLISMN